MFVHARTRIYSRNLKAFALQTEQNRRRKQVKEKQIRIEYRDGKYTIIFFFSSFCTYYFLEKRKKKFEESIVIKRNIRQHLVFCLSIAIFFLSSLESNLKRNEISLDGKKKNTSEERVLDTRSAHSVQCTLDSLFS